MNGGGHGVVLLPVEYRWVVHCVVLSVTSLGTVAGDTAAWFKWLDYLQLSNTWGMYSKQPATVPSIACMCTHWNVDVKREHVLVLFTESPRLACCRASEGNVSVSLLRQLIFAASLTSCAQPTTTAIIKGVWDFSDAGVNGVNAYGDLAADGKSLTAKGKLHAARAAAAKGLK